MNKLTETIETYINGNISTAKKEMLNNHFNGFEVIECVEMFGITQTIKVLKYSGVSDLRIINLFYDYDRHNLGEAKGILLNNFY